MTRSATRPGRRVPPTSIPVRNSILAALLASQYERLLPKLEHVTLKAGDLIYRADQKIEHVYFPEEAVVAMIDTMDDGRTVEVGIIGREGIVGINLRRSSKAVQDCSAEPDQSGYRIERTIRSQVG